MALFQKSVLKKYLKTLDDKKVKAAYDKYVVFFQNEEIIRNIREGKEEQFQYGFLDNLFVNEKAKAQTLQSEIDKTDREIDQMVYSLYGLTEEEIAIVEGS